MGFTVVLYLVGIARDFRKGFTRTLNDVVVKIFWVVVVVVGGGVVCSSVVVVEGISEVVVDKDFVLFELFVVVTTGVIVFVIIGEFVVVDWTWLEFPGFIEPSIEFSSIGMDRLEFPGFIIFSSF